MSLRFVAGSSGAGKSHKVYSEIIRESIRHPERQYLVIVPEQFTMQTQKEIVEMHPKRGLLNVDVLSFNRLAWRVFEETGGNSRPALDDTGKSLIIEKVILEEKKELGALGRTLSRPGSVSEMKSLVSELMQYRKTPDDLEDWIAEQKSRGNLRLAEKLADVETVYRGFEQYTEEHDCIASEQILDVLGDCLPSSELVRGSEIALDGFTGFTPAQNKVVGALLREARSVTVVLTLDSFDTLAKSRAKESLFHMSWSMWDKTRRLAQEAGTEILPDVFVEPGAESRFGASPELAFLEQNIFRFGRRAYEGEVNSIHLMESPDPEAEMRGAAQTILRMVREKGYHYRDFAVVTGDLNRYARPAARIFQEAGIPFFLDQKKAVMTNPAVEFVRAALGMEAEDYSYDSVFRFLRTGLSDLTAAEVDAMENYCRAAGIRGRSRYEKKWLRRTKTIDELEVTALDGLRDRFAEMTEDFHTAVKQKNGTCRTLSEAVYHLLVRCRVQQKIEAYAEKFLEEGEPLLEKEYRQVYRQIMDLLDEVAEILGDEPMKLDDYREILDAGFGETSIGLVPPGEDQVLLGDIERTRLKKIRVLFFAGVNDGIVPKAVSQKGILNETDRYCLSEEQIELAPTAREQMFQQRFYLYLSLTRPSDELYISWCQAGEDGGAALPSYLVGTIRNLFPGASCTVQKTDETWQERLETPLGRREAVLAGLQGIPKEEPDAEVRELLRDSFDAGNGREKAEQMLAAAAASDASGSIGRALAARLYGKTLYTSVSELEDFTRCGFRHFLDYGIGLQEREEYAFTPADFGTIMHEALERYARRMRAEKKAWGSLSDRERDQMADEILDSVFSGDRSGIERGDHILLFQDSERARHMEVRIREMFRRTLWALDEQIRRGAFRPADFEFRVSTDLGAASAFGAENGGSVRLTGRIDRMDECERNGTRYLKILDYKTGQKQWSLSDIYYGQDLQLAVYMDAAIREEEAAHPGLKIEPAGLFYYHIEDPVIDAGKGDIDTEILRKLCPNGLVRNELPILQLFDSGLQAGKKSDVIPAAITKDGTLRSGAHAGDLVAFRTIGAYADRKAADLGQQILAGDARVNPYLSDDGRSGCDYCPYKGICGFDQRVPGYGYRRRRKKSDDEAVLSMAAALGKEEEPGTEAGGTVGTAGTGAAGPAEIGAARENGTNAEKGGFDGRNEVDR